MRVVLKIGTSSITTQEGNINSSAVSALCDEVAILRKLNHEVLIVTSGAVAGGVAALKLGRRPTDMPTLQALAAAGQSRLMQEYNVQLDRHELVGAQVLLVPNDFIDRHQYLHARQTLVRLLELGCVPVINENDAIASDEIRFGDNDRIAALVAHSVSADVLILLTDLKGLYTADPNIDPKATFIETVKADDELLSVRAGSSANTRGSGGMASKLAAARIASWSGVRTVIASAQRQNVVVDALNSVSGAGTQFLPRERELSARKLWIADEKSSFWSWSDHCECCSNGRMRAIYFKTSSGRLNFGESKRITSNRRMLSRRSNRLFGSAVFIWCERSA